MPFLTYCESVQMMTWQRRFRDSAFNDGGQLHAVVGGFRFAAEQFFSCAP